MDWLLAPIDATRAHDVGLAVAWHGRAMVLAWGILAPLAILVARFFKVLPWQDWPRELDTQLWWRSHWMGQTIVLCVTVLGIGLVFGGQGEWNVHAVLGHTVLILLVFQVGMGVFRGTKGGPTAPDAQGSLRGDHYDMTPWRVMFEWVHKLSGYALIALAIVTIGLGMWQANAPNWMWLTLGLWWSAVICVVVALQKKGWAVDTYQAIWGPSEEHPGNQRKPIGWGIRRRVDRQPGE